jgi:hypothetical protein
MSKLKLQITMSLDGFLAGPDQGEEHPLGRGGMRLHDSLPTLEQIEAIPAPGVTHIRYRVS